MSYKSVPQECPTRVSYKSVPQECPTRVSHKSFRQECPIRVSHKSVLQECPTRVSYKSGPQECATRVSYRVSRKSILQECPLDILVFRSCLHSGSWVPSCFCKYITWQMPQKTLLRELANSTVLPNRPTSTLRTASTLTVLDRPTRGPAWVISWRIQRREEQGHVARHVQNSKTFRSESG